MPLMKALVKRGAKVAVCMVERPIPGPDEVLLRVAATGLCRTDIYVAEGRLSCSDPLILGHEFSGTVEEMGSLARGLTRGDRVAVMPILSCGRCRRCQAGDENTCLDTTMLGRHRNGAFAEYVTVPARAAHRVPDSLSPLVAAYAEPVAAALAVLNAGIAPGQKGLILGRNRFAVLISQILHAHGFNDVTLHDPRRDGEPPADAFAFVIETWASAPALSCAIRAAEPHGVLVIRSRNPEPVSFFMPAVLAKELTLRAVNYGPFPKALALLVEGRIDVMPLLGQVRPLEEFAAVFAEALQQESGKFFFTPGSYQGWDR